MMRIHEAVAAFHQAMRDADGLAIELIYLKPDGSRELRKCSPIRRIRGGFVVMCLASGEPRNLLLERVYAAWVVKAADCLVPEVKVFV